MTQLLLDELTDRRNIYVIPATMGGRLFIRFVVCNARASHTDIRFAWNEILAASKSVKNRETNRSQLERIVIKNLQQMLDVR